VAVAVFTARAALTPAPNFKLLHAETRQFHAAGRARAAPTGALDTGATLKSAALSQCGKTSAGGGVKDRVSIDAVGAIEIGDVAGLAKAVDTNGTIALPATALCHERVAEWKSPTVTSAAPDATAPTAARRRWSRRERAPPANRSAGGRAR
jgi:hypothetical protein